MGGNGLIGNEIFKFCLNSNAKVVCIDIKKKKKFPNKKGVFFEKFDVSSLQNVDSFLKKIVNKYGPPTSFINASYPKTKDWSRNSYKHIKLKSYLKNINIHMNSYIWIAKKIADQMIKYKIKNGSIVLLSSIYGILGQDLELYKNTKMAESMSYSAIKGGINNCVRSMASYYGSRNIRVNSIIAGGVSSLQKSSEHLEDEKSLAKSDLLNRNFSNKDCLVGISASGTTPYVIEALTFARELNALSIAIA